MSSSTVTYTLAPPSPDYVPGPEHPPSPDYVPGPEHPPSLDYVPGPEYPEYLVPSDDEVPIKDQPLPADVSPIALSPGYVADSDPSEDVLEKDPEEDPAKFPADGGDDDDYEEEEEEQDEEEEEHLALADSTVLHAINLVPSAEDTKEFKTDKSAPTPHALIVAVVAALPSSSPRASPLTLLSSSLSQIPSPPLPLPSPPTHTSPTYLEAPLGYRAAMIRLGVASPSTHNLSEIPSPPLLLPSTTHKYDILEADIPLRKRARFTTSTGRFEVGESSTAVAAARQPGLDIDALDAAPGCPMSREVCYGITDVWDDMVREMGGRAPTTLEDLSRRVTYFDTTLARDIHEMYVLFEDAQDDQSLLGAQVNTLAVHAELPVYRAKVRALHEQIGVLQRQIQHGHDKTREQEPARDPKPQDGPTNAGSSKNSTIRTTTTPMIDAAIKALIAKGVADALAEYEAHRSSGNGNDSHESGCGRRTERVSRECTYSNFLKCQPLNFKGTEGVVGLTQWFEKMESWNSHVKTVGHDAAYGMPWKTLKKMMTDKYCPRGEIKKLEI
ncbi:hypothetical protein Tco_1182663 [Tanacetum coccineum]